MIRHLRFFAALGAPQDDAEITRQITAGLVVMRLVDEVSSCRERGGEVYTAPAKDAVAALSDSAPAKSVLTEILERIDHDAGSRPPAALGALLVRYGKTLGLESRWDLAADVFRSAAALVAQNDVALAVEAHTLLGGAERRAGQW